MRDGVWAAMVAKDVVEDLTASELGKEGPVEMTEVAGAGVTEVEEGEKVSDVSNVMALVLTKGLEEVA